MHASPRENMQTLLGGGNPSWIPFSLDVGAMPGFTEPIARTFLMPSNLIQPETPWENVVAFAQEARACSARC